MQCIGHRWSMKPLSRLQFLFLILKLNRANLFFFPSAYLSRSQSFCWPSFPEIIHSLLLLYWIISFSLPGLSHPVAQQLPFVVVGRRSIWSGDFLICSQDVCAWPLLLPESLCFLIRRSVSEKQDAQSTHRPHKQTMMISRSWRYAPLVGQSQNYKLPSAGGGGGLLVPRIDDKSPPDRAGGVHIIKAPVLLCRSWSFRSPCHYRPHSHSLQRGFCTKTVAIK